MPNFQCTLFFSDSQKSGWSESYYFVGPSYQSASTALQGLIAVRLPIMHGSYQITGARISDTQGGRNSFLPDLGLPLFGQAAADQFLRPPPSLAALLRFEAGQKHRGHKFLRGFNLSEIKGENLLSSSVITGFNDFAAEIVKNWSLRLQQVFHHTGQKDTRGPVSFSQITAVVPIRACRRKPGRPFGVPRGRISTG